MSAKAIISVWNKEGLEPFGKGLEELGFQILSTGGSAKFLSEKGVNIEYVSDYTGHPEILGGRVKSLHPKIHGGILARRSNESDLQELSELSIAPVDIVAVNLYPFTEKLKEARANGPEKQESLVEFIDIGGPTMIRAAAKNWRDVLAICDPRDYNRVLEALKDAGASGAKSVPESLRLELATKVFKMMAAYDSSIARYFSLGEDLFDEEGALPQLAPVEGVVLEKSFDLRYGENPHQQGALYTAVDAGFAQSEPLWAKLQGKELSYNNLLDMQGALDLFLELKSGLSADEFVSVIIKHSNPCGAALGKTPIEAFTAARACDPVSAFGGIIAVNGELDEALAASMLEGFVEVVLAEDISDAALAVFKKKKNVRLIRCDFQRMTAELQGGGITTRNLLGGVLVQSADNVLAEVSDKQTVSEAKPSSGQLRDLEFAWKITKHVKSNAIVVVKDGKAIGVGAGQMSRVDAAKIAIQRAAEHGHSLEGSVAGSDAFLPFPDALEVLNDAGVSGLVQPGGSIKDDTVISFANERKIVMLATGERHFRH